MTAAELRLLVAFGAYGVLVVLLETAALQILAGRVFPW